MDIDDPPGTQPSPTPSPRGRKQKLLPLPDEGFGSFEFWKKEILAAEQHRDDQYKPDWDRNVKSYIAKAVTPLASGTDIDQVIVPKDFSNVEQKKAQLFFQLPKIQCLPLRPDFEDAVPLAQAVLRFYLSRHRVDGMAVMNRCLTDALICSALMISKIGYESIQDGTTTVTIQQPNPQAGAPAPAAPPLGGNQPPMGGTQSPGSILGLSGPPQPASLPIPTVVPRIISERYFWEPISPAKLLLPDHFTGNNYDMAPWVGFEFVEPWDVAKRKYNLTEDDAKRFSGDDDHKVMSERNNAPARATTDQVRGYELWYKAGVYDKSEKNPDKIRLLILLEGYDKPVRHIDSPYQRFDPQTGKMTVGMKGYPVHVGAMRDLTDSAWPPSEVSVSRVSVDELGKFRTQMSMLRDRAVPQVGYDPQRIGGPQNAEKIRRGLLGGWIPIPGFDPNTPPAGELAKAHANADNYRANDYFDRDIDTVWAFGPNQHGQEAVESRTASEMNLAQEASNTRMAKDRERVVDYFVKGADKLWSLIQLFADDQQFVEIIGDDGARRLAAWDKTKIAGEFVFEAKADSAMQPDYNQDRTFVLKAYELLARDPNVNRVEILHKVAQAFDFDPTRLIIAQLPPKPPEPPKVSITIPGQMLDMGMPEFPLILTMLRQAGYNIPDELLAQMQAHKQQQSAIMTDLASVGIGGDPGLLPAGGNAVPPTMAQPQGHGGAAPRAERLNKHEDRFTNQQTGPKPLIGRVQ